MERISRYPSIAALALAADAIRPDRFSRHPDAWFGDETTAESVRLAQSGDTRLVPGAERLLAQINAAIDTEQRAWQPDMAGAYPIVPEYLAGAPDCMRRRVPVENESAPVQIFVCLSSSGKLSAETMLRRGVAILALVLALAPIRPVELSVFNIGRKTGTDVESVIVAPINTRPLDLAGACYALTSAGFTRRLCYALAQATHFDCAGFHGISWPHGYGQADYMPGLLARLGGDPDRDLILPGSHVNDPIVREPVAWINDQLARFRECVA